MVHDEHNDAPPRSAGAVPDNDAPPRSAGAVPLDEATRAEAWSMLALTLAPITPADSVRDRLLASLRGTQRFTPFAADVARVFGLTLESAREALVLAQDKGAWRAGFFPGSFMLSTPALQAGHVVISRLPAGVRIPMHRHTGREATFVLDGLLIEDHQREHGPGSVLDMQAGTQHELEVAGGEDCLVVFFLAV